jgi:hypothetical protein
MRSRSSQINLDGSTEEARLVVARTPEQRRCQVHGTLLTEDEERDSQLVGQLPRCRECLEKVGLR